jgi:hypothetical protein
MIDYFRRLQYLQQQTIPNIWGNPSAGVPAFMFTMDGLEQALEPVLKHDIRKEAVARLKRLSTQIRGMEARISGLEPRAASIDEKVTSIEKASDTADQLPEDLASLSEAKKQMETILREAIKDQVQLTGIRDESENIRTGLQENFVESEAVLERSRTAYSAATSVGLAAAFTERSNGLAWSMWVWVLGLVSALLAGSLFGTERVKALMELLREPNQPASIIIPNIILSVLAVGAPIWFAWLATKQIGQRFRLSEDYAFKASISRAYEGFRREAARVDPELEAKLLASALTRLDELPLRLVETETHGSPWHELANSEVVKEAIKAFPGFASEVRQLAEKTVAQVGVVRAVKMPSPTSGEIAKAE